RVFARAPNSDSKWFARRSNRSRDCPAVRCSKRIPSERYGEETETLRSRVVSVSCEKLPYWTRGAMKERARACAGGDGGFAIADFSGGGSLRATGFSGFSSSGFGRTSAIGREKDPVRSS